MTWCDNDLFLAGYTSAPRSGGCAPRSGASAVLVAVVERTSVLTAAISAAVPAPAAAAASLSPIAGGTTSTVAAATATSDKGPGGRERHSRKSTQSWSYY
jgi:hypothetical protein